MPNVIQNRYEFILLFDVLNGNPNGDPDAGNLPRVDAETGCGLVTDVCLKRKIRNYVALTQSDNPPYEIYIKEKAILNQQHERAYLALEEQGVNTKEKGKENKIVEEARKWMCQNFYDIRTFGAVMSTGDKKCGQVKGPVQLTFSRSIDQIVSAEHTITRMAVTTEADSYKERTMGRKFTVPYGLYQCHGFISAHFAQETGFSVTDLALFFEALQNMFDHDHSAARGMMSTQKLIIFEHDSKLGNAPAHGLFNKLSVEKMDGENNNLPPRRFEDYVVTYDNKPLSHSRVITYSVKSPEEVVETTDPIWKRSALVTA